MPSIILWLLLSSFAALCFTFLWWLICSTIYFLPLVFHFIEFRQNRKKFKKNLSASICSSAEHLAKSIEITPQHIDLHMFDGRNYRIILQRKLLQEPDLEEASSNLNDIHQRVPPYQDFKTITRQLSSQRDIVRIFSDAVSVDASLKLKHGQLQLVIDQKSTRTPNISVITYSHTYVLVIPS